MLKTLKLIRLQGDQSQTMGVLIVQDEKCRPLYIRPCIERGYRDNQQNVSNVPAGLYPIKYEYSPKFSQVLWELKNVPGRSECKIYAANYWRSEEHTSELQSREKLVCRLLLEKKSI